MKKGFLAGTATVCVIFMFSSGILPGSTGILPGQQETGGTGDKIADPATGQSTRTVKRGRPDPFAPLKISVRPRLVRPTPKEEQKPEIAPVALSELALSGIVWSPRRPLAVINRTLLGVNDTILGWKIANIERDKVVVEQKGRKEILKIKSSIFEKKRVRGTQTE